MASSRKTDPKLFVFPGNIEPDVLAAGHGQVPYARTQQFGSLVIECERWLLHLLGCTGGRVIPLTASGTAAMEAIVANITDEDSQILAVDGGTFGKRWVEMLRLYPHARVDVVNAPFGKDLDYGRMEEMLTHGRYRALFMQHHETSSGALFNVARLGATCRKVGTLFVVDAISSFLADEFSMDEFAIDAAVISSHKGLCLPPGLAFVVLSERLLSEPFQRRCTYLDFTENLRSLERGQTLFTPAVLAFLQLHWRLQGFAERGVSTVIESVSAKAMAFRALLLKDRRVMVSEVPSNCLTSFRLKCGARDLVTRLAQSGWYVLPSSEQDQIRVAHLGASSVLDHDMLYERICEIEDKLCGGTA